jgi:RNA polymerase sigma factor (TIGR02999 family)
LSKDHTIDLMSDPAESLISAEDGKVLDTETLLPVVYAELRKLAAQKMAREKPGQTLQATSLVHEAFLRLMGASREQHWNGTPHFFAAAAEAMRRILVENARRKRRLRHGGDLERVELNTQIPGVDNATVDLLALDEALTQLAAEEPETAEVVKLRYFAGLTVQEAAAAMGISARTVHRHWAYAQAWLFERLK